jgi:hypothetical protein
LLPKWLWRLLWLGQQLSQQQLSQQQLSQQQLSQQQLLLPGR